MSFRTLTVLLALAAILAPRARSAEAQPEAAPLVQAAPAPKLPGSELRSFVAARRAMELGFPSVAAHIYTELLASLKTPGPERDALVLELATARLDEGRADEAEKVLALHSDARGAAYQLRAGLAAAQARRFDEARAALAAARPDGLAAGDRAWWHFLQGLTTEAGGDYAKAREAYQRADDAAASDAQRAHFTLARERARLLMGETSESQLNTLRQNVERNQGKTVGYAYARQYAVLLAARGRGGEAAEFLSVQLQSLPAAERAARDDFRLLLGLIAGAQRAEGRNALEGLVASADDTMLRRVALHLLVRDAADAAFFVRLNGWITATPANPVLPDLLLARAQLGLVEKKLRVAERPGALEPAATANQAQAEQDAKALLARFPNSGLRPAALTLLADLAWEQQRFRTAADYAAQARAELPAGETRAALGVMMAEAHFRAGDFRAADEAYAVALRERPRGVNPGTLISQQILSKIQAGRLDEASALLDSFSADARFGVIERWQSEWTLARALQAAGRDADAYARVNRLLGASGAPPEEMPAVLRARLAWLQARLSIDADTPARTLGLARALPPLLAGLGEPLRSEAEAGTRLLEARARFRLGEPEEALKTLEALRADFPKADAAVYSYIDEADHHAANNRFVDAQGRLTKLADDFKDHPYAPYALYRAALNAERRGQNEYYEDAYRILERLVQDYPKDDLVFYARLKQGDLARRLNDFPRAMLTYEHLINNYAQHAGVLQAELALAACHRAQITPGDVSHYESALAILERLQDLPAASVDLRVEAGFQLGDLLATREAQSDVAREQARARAQAVWWTLVTTYLLDDAQAARLGSRGRYWIARALLRFGDLRRDSGDLEEARNAYELILKKNLPFAKLAREVFIRAGGNPGA